MKFPVNSLLAGTGLSETGSLETPSSSGESYKPDGRNCALGIIAADKPTLAPIEGEEITLPTAIFFHFEGKAPDLRQRRRSPAAA
jgi:hypothetical protein